MPERYSPLITALSDILETNLVPAKFLSGGSVGAKIAYGKESSIMLATRQPQYHSRPHAHDSEQLNYVLEGELYVFIEESGFLARKGDVFRIPRNAIHWSWVQGTTPCVLLETHTPPLIGDPGVTDTACGLIGDEEDRERIVAVVSQWPSDVDQNAVERRVMLSDKVA
ncbi:MAG TPA: cupin domain-containing protein [Xanthobacteraceae bacterium]|nr:cupin domain-containing protein [Xanthobacteraceae bacterium]